MSVLRRPMHTSPSIRALTISLRAWKSPKATFLDLLTYPIPSCLWEQRLFGSRTVLSLRDAVPQPYRALFQTNRQMSGKSGASGCRYEAHCSGRERPVSRDAAFASPDVVFVTPAAQPGDFSRASREQIYPLYLWKVFSGQAGLAWQDLAVNSELQNEDRRFVRCV